MTGVQTCALPILFNHPKATSSTIIIVEPIAAGITILLKDVLIQVLPYLLAFAAGAMIYVVVEELIPETSEGEHSNIGTIGFALGFTIMMVLDVALG